MTTGKELLYREVGRAVLREFDLERLDWAECVSRRATKLLDEIGAVLRDETLDDFMVVDEIVSLYTRYGLDSGGRHDFG